MEKDEKVLVVDDEKDVTSFLASFLRRRNIKVFSTTSPAEALEIYKKEKPPMVFLDIVMPDMDGLTVLKKMKSLAKDSRIIMLTSKKSPAVIAEAKKLGAEAFLSKPVELSEIDEIIKSVFSGDKV